MSEDIEDLKAQLAAAEAAAKAAEAEAARQRAAERRTRQVENVLGSILRTAGREITRSIFGTRKR